MSRMCCGRPMQPEGGKRVCSRCGAWEDPGLVAGGGAR